jgi:polyhydroxyalkanoate synthesis regulator phasin
MVIDALRGYLQLANGLTEVTRQRATAAAKALVSQTGASVEQAVPDQLQRQVHGLAEELVATSRANRDMLVSVVLSEIERAVTRLGLVTAEDQARTTQAVDGLAQRVATLEASVLPTVPPGPSTTPRAAEQVAVTEPPPVAAAPAAPAKKATATKAQAKKSPAKKSPASKAPASKAPASKAPASKAPASKAPAKNVPTKKATAKKTATTKTATTKTAPPAETAPPAKAADTPAKAADKKATAPQPGPASSTTEAGP